MESVLTSSSILQVPVDARTNQHFSPPFVQEVVRGHYKTKMLESEEIYYRFADL